MKSIGDIEHAIFVPIQDLCKEMEDRAKTWEGNCRAEIAKKQEAHRRLTLSCWPSWRLRGVLAEWSRVPSLCFNKGLRKGDSPCA